MKNGLLSLFLLVSCWNPASAQEFRLNVFCHQEVRLVSEDKEVPLDGDFNNVFLSFAIEYLELYQGFEKSFHFLEDSVYSKTKLDVAAGSYYCKFQSPKESVIINTITGQRDDYRYRLFDFMEELYSKLKKVPKSDKQILGFDCEAYRSDAGEVSLLMYVSKSPLGFTGKVEEQAIIYKNRLVLYYEIQDRKKDRRAIFQVDSINNQPEYYEQLAAEVKGRADQLKQNSAIPAEPPVLNSVVPNLYFQDVHTQAYQSLYQYKQNGKYLVIDFWGTWCKPCLAAIPELKAFYEAHKDQVDILSLDYKDSLLGIVQEKIKELGMSWDQGVATEQINAFLNPEEHFPGIVVLDDEMRLVLRMKAKDALEKMREILRQRN